jgi:hypothetical protein
VSISIILLFVLGVAFVLVLLAFVVALVFFWDRRDDGEA